MRCTWRTPAIMPPTSASTESMKGIPMIPNRRQNTRPLRVFVATFPYPGCWVRHGVQWWRWWSWC